MMKKASLLALASIVAVVLLTLAAAYLSSAVNESGFSEREKKNSQAVNLAEAGLYQAIAELKERILLDLDTVIKDKTIAFFTVYAGSSASKNSLDFLHEMLTAYFSAPNAQGEITMGVVPLAFNANIPNTSREIGIIIRKQKDASGNDKEAYQEGSDVFKFPYEFTINARGSVSGINKNVRFLQGKFELTVHRVNFARFALFTNHHTSPSGERVWFTERTRFYGPVHTNEQFCFANNPSAYFDSEVTQGLLEAYFYNQGWPRPLASDHNGSYDVPTFNQGFQRGADTIDLADSITTNNMRAKVGYQTTGGSGIYIPNDGTSVTGGIYIKGYGTRNKDNASIAMSTNGEKQVYEITQNSVNTYDRVIGSTTKTVTVDYTANAGAGSTKVQTVLKDAYGVITSTSEETLQGIPDGTEDKGILIYSDDDLGCRSADGCSNRGLSGTVAKASQATIASERDIVISDHVRYEEFSTSPRLNAEGFDNVLGIISWGGDVVIGTTTPSNLDVHGVIMAVLGAFTVDNYRTRSPSGDVNLLGGVISNTYGAFGTFSGTSQVSGYGRNFLYDERMLAEMTPPYYPTTTDFGVLAPELDKDIDTMGLIWQQT
ncbi:MAG: DUF4900 domain-containing protein [Candidatus Omnitrophica bacterium]|nr:DUF4900 domain-containing protein [Candidatus Omnitrophota bacterium]